MCCATAFSTAHYVRMLRLVLYMCLSLENAVFTLAVAVEPFASFSCLCELLIGAEDISYEIILGLQGLYS